MKAKMRAKLVDCKIEQNNMTIVVFNLGDKRATANKQAIAPQPITLTVDGIAVKKMAEFSHLLTEDNKIILKLELTNNLATVSNILEAKVNGVEIDFKDLETAVKETAASEKLAEERLAQQQNNVNRGLFKFVYALIVIALMIFLFSAIR